jgi:uncharacterized protein (DUF2249 family)
MNEMPLVARRATILTEATMTLDVREDIRDGREPFSRIMETVARLTDGQSLRLIVPFEPVPLFDVLARRGFSHEARPRETGDWEVLFTRSSGDSTEKTPATSQSDRGFALLDVDARGLEPPQPLVVILEALANLPPGGEMRAHTDRRPLHLYAQLEDRGFTGETEEQHDGSFVTTIRRA